MIYAQLAALRNELRARGAYVLDSKGNTILDPNYVLTTASGLKVGFFGMETPEAQTKLGGQITAAEYGNVKGNITIK